MIAIVTKKRLAFLEEEAKQAELMRSRIDELEADIHDVRIKYGILLRENDSLVKQSEESKSLAESVSATDFKILKNASPALIAELASLVDSVARYVAAGSLKIRKVEGIAYRD